MFKETILTISVLAFGLMASTANATTIDFEEFSTGNLSNVETINGVEFSVIDPTDDTALRIFNDATRTAYLLSCDFSLSSPCVKGLNVDFGAPVNDVSFDFLAEDLPAGEVSGTVSAYLDGALVGTIDLISNGATVPNLVDLSVLGPIDQLILDPSLDPAGLGYDNFSFSVVPVPAAVWLFGSGLIGLVGLARRKKV